MRLDRNQRIDGFPIKTLRDFLRSCCGSFTLGYMRKRLAASEPQARSLIKSLEARGLIMEGGAIHQGKAGQEPFWETTTQGNALCCAKFLKPLPREKAFQILDAFLGRVQEVNKDDGFIYAITYAGLFGSLSKGAEEVGDIDLIVSMRLKPQTDPEEMHPFSYYLRHELHALKFLKNRNPYLSITTEEERCLQTLNIVPQRLFPL